MSPGVRPVALACLLALAACSSVPFLGGSKKKDEALDKTGRVTMVLTEEKIEASPELATQPIELPVHGKLTRTEYELLTGGYTVVPEAMVPELAVGPAGATAPAPTAGMPDVAGFVTDFLAGVDFGAMGTATGEQLAGQMSDDEHAVFEAMLAEQGRSLADYVAAIESLASANRTLTAFHVRRRADIEAAVERNVDEALDAMPVIIEDGLNAAMKKLHTKT